MEKSVKSRLIVAGLNGLCALLWLYQWMFRERGTAALVCGGIWLIGAAVWMFRAASVKKR